ISLSIYPIIYCFAALGTRCCNLEVGITSSISGAHKWLIMRSTLIARPLYAVVRALSLNWCFCGCRIVYLVGNRRTCSVEFVQIFFQCFEFRSARLASNSTRCWILHHEKLKIAAANAVAVASSFMLSLKFREAKECL